MKLLKLSYCELNENMLITEEQYNQIEKYMDAEFIVEPYDNYIIAKDYIRIVEVLDSEIENLKKIVSGNNLKYFVQSIEDGLNGYDPEEETLEEYFREGFGIYIKL